MTNAEIVKLLETIRQGNEHLINPESEVIKAAIEKKARTETAQIDKESRVEVAKIEKDGKVETAKIEKAARVEAAQIEADSKLAVAEIEATNEKRNRIAMYVTSGIGLLGTAATIISRWMMFSTGLKFEQDGVYTSPMTKSMAQDAVRDKNTKF